MFTSRPNSPSKSNRQLIAECLRGDSLEAWHEFVRCFQPLISGVIARVADSYGDRTTGLIDELTQETFFKLCNNACSLLRKVKLYDDESLFKYLKVVAGNLARDYFRANRAQKRGPNSYGGDLGTADRHQAADGPALSSSEQSVLSGEIEECLKKVTQGETAERDRLIFKLHYYQGFTTREIAAFSAIDLSSKGVESVLRRIVVSLRSELVAKSTLRISAKA